MGIKIDFTKPELYQTRCNAPFEIYNAERRHGYVDSLVGAWATDGSFMVNGMYKVEYDLVLKRPDPIVMYMVKTGGVVVFDIESPMSAHMWEKYEHTTKLTIIGEDITTEIIHRRGE